jgi:subtilisin-like proprotein convertase family protein
MKHAQALCIAIATGLAHAGSVCVSPSATIPDNNATGIDIPIEIDAGANELIETVTVSLDIDHPWVGDLVVTLRSPSGTMVTLLDRPGIPSTGFPGPFGCGGRDLDATFSDSASVLAEDVCSYSAQPVIAGDVVPAQPLLTFAGEPATGEWTLTVSDRSANDAGVLIEACIQLTTTITCTPDLTGDGVLDFFDVSAFLSAYSAQDPAADFTGDGQYDFFDVSAFLNAYSTGCP